MSSSSTDSAGVPWAGRTLEANPFAGDDGTIAPAVKAAMDQCHATGDRPVRGFGDSASAVETLCQALMTAGRVLVPVMAFEQEEGSAVVTPTGVEVAPDKAADVGYVSIVAPDGRAALPIFTDVAAMQAWNPQARPIPTDTQTAFLAAVSEDAHVIVVNAAGPTPVVIPRPAVWAHAQGEQWVPFLHDDDARQGVAHVLEALPFVHAVSFTPGTQREVKLTCAIIPGLNAEQFSHAKQLIAATLSSRPEVADRIDSLALAFTAAQ